MSTSFFKKTYLLLALHLGLSASFLYDFFLGSVLFVAGWSLSNILFFFLLEFAVRGAFHFMAPYVAGRIGISRTILLSYASLSVFFVLLGLYASQPALVLLFSIFHSLGRGLVYPVQYFIKARTVDNQERGRFYGLEVYVMLIFLIITTWFVAPLLDVSLVLPVLISVASLCIGFMLLRYGTTILQHFELAPISKSFPQYAKEVFAQADARILLAVLFSKGTWVIVKVIFIPLLLFQITGSFALTGGVFTLALVAELVFLLFAGRVIDSNWKRPFGFISAYLLVFLLYGFAGMLYVPNIGLMILLVVAWRIFSHGFAGINEVTIQNFIRSDGNPLVLAGLQEGILCWIEAIILAALIAISAVGGIVPTFVAGLFLGGAGILTFITVHAIKKQMQ